MRLLVFLWIVAAHTACTTYRTQYHQSGSTAHQASFWNHRFLAGTISGTVDLSETCPSGFGEVETLSSAENKVAVAVADAASLWTRSFLLFTAPVSFIWSPSTVVLRCADPPQIDRHVVFKRDKDLGDQTEIHDDF